MGDEKIEAQNKNAGHELHPVTLTGIPIAYGTNEAHAASEGKENNDEDYDEDEDQETQPTPKTFFGKFT